MPLPELMLPTLGLGYGVKKIAKSSVSVGKVIAKGHKQTQDVNGISVGNWLCLILFLVYCILFLYFLVKIFKYF
ncbi:hypothetical protein SIXOD_v1c10980 [Spiroplasma ixodetis Y32]|nr:hypothetical protein SIXOD_v1c10980 [Spiroplasma ixodetis Y32]